MAIVDQLVQRLGGDRGGVVGLSLRFLNDDLELPRELAAVDQRMRVRIGLHVEAGGETQRRKHGVVDRVVVDRRRVQVATRGFRFLRDLTHAAARRALEVHVLEHVRDAHDVIGLVEVPGAHEGDDRDNGSRRIAPDQHGQTVRQPRAHHGQRRQRRRR